ncbi:hypothetical protein RFI_34584, partial [Reticulomyxa filosa]
VPLKEKHILYIYLFPSLKQKKICECIHRKKKNRNADKVPSDSYKYIFFDCCLNVTLINKKKKDTKKEKYKKEKKVCKKKRKKKKVIEKKCDIFYKEKMKKKIIKKEKEKRV